MAGTCWTVEVETFKKRFHSIRLSRCKAFLSLPWVLPNMENNRILLGNGMFTQDKGTNWRYTFGIRSKGLSLEFISMFDNVKLFPHQYLPIMNYSNSVYCYNIGWTHLLYFWSNYYSPGGMYSVVGQGLGNSILSSFSFDLNNFDNFPHLHSTLTQLAAKV